VPVYSLQGEIKRHTYRMRGRWCRTGHFRAVLQFPTADAVIAARDEDASSTRTELSEQETQTSRIFLRDIGSSVKYGTLIVCGTLGWLVMYRSHSRYASPGLARRWARSLHGAADGVVDDRGRVRHGHAVLGVEVCPAWPGGFGRRLAAVDRHD
jgi:hypothetical protein